MNHTTFDTYKAASKLQRQALETMNSLEVLADDGVRKAEDLLNTAWNVTTSVPELLTAPLTFTGETFNGLSHPSQLCLG